jgi:hypothetical protein
MKNPFDQFYQRVDRRLGILTQFFFCRRCGRKYAA